jgi:hypothetical protein
MGYEIEAKSFIGIKITLDEIKMAFLKYIKEHPEGECEKKDDDYDDDNAFYFSESKYHGFMKGLMKKYNLKFENINHYDGDRNDEIELCVYFWKQEPESMWGRADYCRRYIVNSDFMKIQECFSKKRDDLTLFMNELSLDKESHRVQIFTIIVGS